MLFIFKYSRGFSKLSGTIQIGSCKTICNWKNKKNCIFRFICRIKNKDLYNDVRLKPFGLKLVGPGVVIIFSFSCSISYIFDFCYRD